MGTRRRGSGAAQSWVKPTEAAGAAEEAHRRWPGGRSEQGALERQKLSIQVFARYRAGAIRQRMGMLSGVGLRSMMAMATA
jgi:hypothetical protein